MSIDGWLFILVLVIIFFMVFYRLMLAAHDERPTGHKARDWGAVFSLPSRRHIPVTARKYYRRYWIALGLLVLLLTAGTVRFGSLMVFSSQIASETSSADRRVTGNQRLLGR